MSILTTEHNVPLLDVYSIVCSHSAEGKESSEGWKVTTMQQPAKVNNQ